MLGTSDLGRGSFNATAVTGNITSTAAITPAKGGVASDLFGHSGQHRQPDRRQRLSGANHVAVPGLRRQRPQCQLPAKVTDVTGALPATVTDLTLTFDNAAAVLPAITINNLTVTALGIVQQSGTALVISGTGTFSTGAMP